MMLDAGAETDVVNSVGRTAAQMAAFVGASGCGVRLFTRESSVLQRCLLTVTHTKDHTHSVVNFGPYKICSKDVFTFVVPMQRDIIIKLHSVASAIKLNNNIKTL